MKFSDSPTKQNTGRARTVRLSTVILLVLLILSLLGVVFAWFIDYRINSVSGTDIAVSSGDVMTVSFSEDGDFKNTIKFTYDNLKLQHVSGDGLNMYFPALLQEFDEENHENYAVPVSGDPANWRTAISTEWCEQPENLVEIGGTMTADYSMAEYISFPVYFKSNSQVDIYLGSDSVLKPADLTDPSHRSGYGNFSCDYIAAAARVAIYDENDKLLLAWAPNSQVELSYDGYTTIDDPTPPKGWTLNTNSTNIEEYEYYHKTVRDSAELYETIKCGATGALIKTMWTELPDVNIDKELPADAVRLLTLKSVEGAFNEYMGMVKVKIWIEGTDREARRALAGGLISADLHFAAFSHIE